MTLDLTTVVALDTEHLEELKLVWPLWELYRPELLEHPLLLLCDDEFNEIQWKDKLAFLSHPNFSIQLWGMNGVSQREKMLTSLVLGVAQYVQTTWYLKLDTDAVPTERADWMQSQWFAPNERGEQPVFVCSPWGYTKPADAIDRLDQWAMTVDELSTFENLEIHGDPDQTRVMHDRIISWCFFGNTVWTQEVAGYCEHQSLPIPSQDTFLWYCAARRGDYYRTINMSQLGWKHVHPGQLENFCTNLSENLRSV